MPLASFVTLLHSYILRESLSSPFTDMNEKLRAVCLRGQGELSRWAHLTGKWFPGHPLPHEPQGLPQSQRGGHTRSLLEPELGGTVRCGWDIGS